MSGDPTSFDSIRDARADKHSAQWWLLFAILVANKPAEITTRKLNSFLDALGVFGLTPFAKLRSSSPKKIEASLRSVKTGQYKRVLSAFLWLRNLSPDGDDPRIWGVPDVLECVPGIGPKTARWYTMLVEPDYRCAALDTHILKFLRDNGVPDAPRATPPAGKTYQRLEDSFLAACDTVQMKPRDLDYLLWAVYRRGGKVLLNKKSVETVAK